jgi:hypothetical protein
VNAAYDNSTLCSELTRHSARPPVDGIYRVAVTKNPAELWQDSSFIEFLVPVRQIPE